MSIIDLDAGFVHSQDRGLMLILRCPLCGKHHVGIPVTVGIRQPGRWMITSKDLATLSVDPSILHAWNKEVKPEDRCPYHFRIVKGNVVLC